MPNPTTKQLLRNYPSHFIDMFGNARIQMLLDCTDQHTQDSSLRQVHSNIFSQYHAQTGAKFGVGCTPLGCVPHAWHTEAYGSSISDDMLVNASEMLALLEAGAIVETDKGFLIENLAAKFGIQIYRPSTFRDNLKQQGRGNTEKTQTVGNTRIIIEQVNKEGKTEFRLFRGKFPIQMKDLLTPLMRNGFMMANFRRPKIIGRSKSEPSLISRISFPET